MGATYKVGHRSWFLGPTNSPGSLGPHFLDKLQEIVTGMQISSISEYNRSIQLLMAVLMRQVLITLRCVLIVIENNMTSFFVVFVVNHLNVKRNLSFSYRLPVVV